ncbi:MAG: class B sortase [Pseudobutyrivibrio sp.]|nr:class B sortase [Pseudobutyrivibrio sp.]
MSSAVKSIDKDNHRAEFAFSGNVARGGNTVLSLIAVFIVIVLTAYAAYSLLYTYQVYNDAFLDSEIIDLRPTFSGDSTDNRATFKELLAINEDTTSWVTIDGTLIDYPVMQGEDDYEYVNKNVYGDFELSGSIFLSAGNSKDFSDPYNLLYGHHIANGGMFGDVMKYTSEAFFNKNSTGILYLPDATYSITIYACVECSAYDDNIFYGAKDQTEMADFQAWVKENATHYRDIGVTENDKIIALTTCENATTDGRCAIVGRLDKIATVEQSFEDDTEVAETTADGNVDGNAAANVITTRDYVVKAPNYYYLIIIGVFLISLLIIGLMQQDGYISPSMTENEILAVEKKSSKKAQVYPQIFVHC